MSKSALSSVLEEIKENGMPSATSKASIKRARDEELNVNTPYGKPLKDIDVPNELGPAGTFCCLSPSALLYYLATSSAVFYNFL